MDVKERIACRVAQELKQGDVVNLGIGLPTLVPNYLPSDVTITLQSENGLLGMGPRQGQPVPMPSRPFSDCRVMVTSLGK